jgi:WD40 repeat protein
MARALLRCWRGVAAIATLSFVAFLGIISTRAAGLYPAKMSAEEIKAVELRLTDAGCYKGAIDGTASAALDEAIKACPDQRPFLRIETGMHTAITWSIGVDAACRLLATASDDKTVRLWSLPEGKLQRVVRGPIDYGDAGKVRAAALSPDGHWLAAGGWYAPWGHSLFIVDLWNGGIRRFGPFRHVINRVAFSLDGQRVAVGLGNGVSVFDRVTGAELLADRDYGDQVYGVAFAPDGGLITSSLDGQLRRYGRYRFDPLKMTVKRSAPDGKAPFDVAIDPTGRRVAVGYVDETPVSILDATTLKPITKAQTDDLSNGDLSSVAWSRDGATLVAGGNAQAQFQGERHHFLRRFDPTGRRQGADTSVTTNATQDIRPCGEGFAFVASDPAFGLLSTQGVATILQSPRTADMQGKLGGAFAVSPDASSVRFGLGYGGDKPVVFDLTAALLGDSPSLPSGFETPRVEGLPVTGWDNAYAPRFGGAKITLDEYERSNALAIRSDASGFALGTDWSVRAYDANGKELWHRETPDVAGGVDFSADGQILVVAYRDGTIRWLRWSDGAELLALFVEPQTRKWVAWTPSGYYTASAGGEDLIGWHINRGWDQEADFFPASQFRADYNRPDIVRLVLKTRDEGEAIRQANLTSDRSVEAKPVAAALPPIVTIVSPGDGANFSQDSVEIAYSLRSPSSLPVDRLDILADGVPVPVAGFAKTTSAEAPGKVVATLPRKDTKVSLIAHSGDLTSAPVSVKLVYNGPSAPAADLLKPKLYALLVGVTGYANPDYNSLQFAGHDAETLAKALEAQKGGLYSDVQTRLIADATQHNVFAGLDWLRREATARDLAIVFLAGHGFLDGKQKFWFLTREADTEQLRTTAISNDDLLDAITSVPGKKILFIDACHAGAAMVASRAVDTDPDMNKVVNDFSTAGSGLIVYGASTGTERAKEDAKWDRHGAFTKALIEAIGEGKAALDPSGRITTDTLDFYIEEHVKAMTNGAQHPVMNRPVVIPDFPLALAKP